MSALPWCTAGRVLLSGWQCQCTSLAQEWCRPDPAAGRKLGTDFLLLEHTIACVADEPDAEIFQFREEQHNCDRYYNSDH